MTENIQLSSSLLAAGVLMCGMLGCLVPMVGKAKCVRSPWKHLPLTTRIVLLILTVSLTFVGATKINRISSVSSPWGISSSVSHVGNTSVGSTNALEQTNGSLAGTARFLDIDVATNGTVSLIAHRLPEADVEQLMLLIVGSVRNKPWRFQYKLRMIDGEIHSVCHM